MAAHMANKWTVEGSGRRGDEVYERREQTIGKQNYILGIVPYCIIWKVFGTYTQLQC